MKKTEAILQEQNSAIKNLEIQMGQMALAMTNRAPGTLPSNTEVNPREHAKAITTRSGVQLPEIHIKKPVTNEESVLTSDEEQVEQTELTPEENAKMSSDTPRVKATAPVNPYEPPIPFPQRLKKHKLDKQYRKFLEVFKKLHINIPFADALVQMPSYAKFLKDILSNKRKLEEHETVMLTEESSAMIQKKLPPKLKDPGSFTVPCSIGNCYFKKALCDLGASINLMPLSVFRNLGLGEAKATTVTLQLADRSLTYPRGIIEDVLIKVDKFIFPIDFLILDMEEDKDVPLILGRPFLATGGAIIDVQKCQLILRLGEEQISFNVFKAMRFPTESDSCFQIDVIDSVIENNFHLRHPTDAYEACIAHSQSIHADSLEIEECARILEANPPYVRKRYFEDLGSGTTIAQPFIQQPPKLELKQLPSHLRYAYLGESSTLPVIVLNSISKVEEERLLWVLRDNKTAIGWSIADIKGLSPSYCMHKILMEENFKPKVDG